MALAQGRNIGYGTLNGAEVSAIVALLEGPGCDA